LPRGATISFSRPHAFEKLRAETRKIGRLTHVTKLDSTAAGWRGGNCSELFGPGDNLDILLLAARDPGHYFRDSGKWQSSSR
jgi:hypothetical protein